MTSPSDVQSIVLSEKPARRSSVTYTGETGATQTVAVTLGIGPAQ